MLQISQIKLRPDQGTDALEGYVRKILHLRESDEFTLQIHKKSIDARKKPDIFYVYTVLVTMKNQERERKILRKNHEKNVEEAHIHQYEVPGQAAGKPAGTLKAAASGQSSGSSENVLPEGLRPVIIGTGPAGLFCGLALARAGKKPVLIERGQSVKERTESVENFWEGQDLDPESNVQFGEGGAGTFSDGKLNTGVKDPYGRIRFVLDTFVEAGADPEIMYSYKPHIGTDVLKTAVAHIRDEIIMRGGEVRFSSKLKRISRADAGQADAGFHSGDALVHGSPVWDLEIEDTHEKYVYHLQSDRVVLAIGHSSRDTFRMLKDQGFDMTPKAFAVGLRIQHPQGMIDSALYGKDCAYQMPPSPYKLTHRLRDGRGVYSFCMCPGGYVVNASSEPGCLAVNGMSYHDRASANANSAIVVTVSPEDIRGYLTAMRREPVYDLKGMPFYDADQTLPGRGSAGEAVLPGGKGQGEDVFDGIEFQRRMEHAAYLQGRGSIPVQTFLDYCRSGKTRHCGEDPESSNLSYGMPGKDRGHDMQTIPVFKGAYRAADVRGILPWQIGDAIEEGILSWDRQIHGFADPSALLAGVESRTSSPVRIGRGEDLQALHFPGIYPCGEGAGYAGGITSAAVDGLRVAEALIASMG